VTKRYNTLKAEYRRLAYQLKDVYDRDDAKSKKLSLKIITKMKKLDCDIYNESTEMARMYSRIAEELPAMDVETRHFDQIKEQTP